VGALNINLLTLLYIQKLTINAALQLHAVLLLLPYVSEICKVVASSLTSTQLLFDIPWSVGVPFCKGPSLAKQLNMPTSTTGCKFIRNPCQSYEVQLPYGTMQCYLPRGTGECAPPKYNPKKTSQYLIYLYLRDGRLS